MTDSLHRAHRASKHHRVPRLTLVCVVVLAAGAITLTVATIGSAQAPRAAATPFQARAIVNLPASFSPVTVRISVPAGRRLDIERVTVIGNVSSGQSGQAQRFVMVLNTTVGNKKGSFPLPQPEFAPSSNLAQPLSLILNTPMFGAQADGGKKSPTLTVDRTDLSSFGSMAVTLSGQLE